MTLVRYSFLLQKKKRKKKRKRKNFPLIKPCYVQLIDGFAGASNIYKARGTSEQPNLTQKLPKRVHFAMDISGSMYRFNGTDQRLDRLLECTCLIMEAFQDFEAKYNYAITVHTSPSPCRPLDLLVLTTCGCRVTLEMDQTYLWWSTRSHLVQTKNV